jgi:hypothetical protein
MRTTPGRAKKLRMEIPMSIKTKFAAVAIATLTIVGGIAASTQSANAGWKHHHGWHGAGYGFAAGALIGAAAAGAYASGPVYVSGYNCRWVRQYNQFGQYMGKTKVCGY